jgi:hypothetical protein
MNTPRKSIFGDIETRVDQGDWGDQRDQEIRRLGGTWRPGGQRTRVDQGNQGTRWTQGGMGTERTKGTIGTGDREGGGEGFERWPVVRGPGVDQGGSAIGTRLSCLNLGNEMYYIDVIREIFL